MVSLGTGTSVATEQSKAGLTYWAGKMLSMPTDTYRVHKEVEALLPGLNGPDCEPASYFRLEPVIQNLELDECRKYVLDEMKDTTASYIAAHSAKVERLCSVLLIWRIRAISKSLRANSFRAVVRGRSSQDP